jgi:hypothetical protein
VGPYGNGETVRDQRKLHGDLRAAIGFVVFRVILRARRIHIVGMPGRRARERRPEAPMAWLRQGFSAAAASGSLRSGRSATAHVGGAMSRKPTR